MEGGLGDAPGDDFFGVKIKVNLDNNNNSNKSVIIVNLLK